MVIIGYVLPVAAFGPTRSILCLQLNLLAHLHVLDTQPSSPACADKSQYGSVHGRVLHQLLHHCRIPLSWFGLILVGCRRALDCCHAFIMPRALCAVDNEQQSHGNQRQRHHHVAHLVILGVEFPSVTPISERCNHLLHNPADFQ